MFPSRLIKCALFSFNTYTTYGQYATAFCGRHNTTPVACNNFATSRKKKMESITTGYIPVHFFCRNARANFRFSCYFDWLKLCREPDDSSSSVRLKSRNDSWSSAEFWNCVLFPSQQRQSTVNIRFHFVAGRLAVASGKCGRCGACGALFAADFHFWKPYTVSMCFIRTFHKLFLSSTSIAFRLSMLFIRLQYIGAFVPSLERCMLPRRPDV